MSPGSLDPDQGEPREERRKWARRTGERRRVLEERRKQHPYDALAPHWQFVWRCTVSMVVGLFLAWLGGELAPSGEAVKRLLARGYLPWMTATDNSPAKYLLPKALIDRTSYGTARAMPDKVVVVSIDDEDLRALNDVWPMSLAYYASFIRRLLQLDRPPEKRSLGERPRAIFLDVLLIDPRPDSEVMALREAVCAAYLEGIPVWLASIPGTAGPTSPEALLLPCVKLTTPFTNEDKYDRAAWEYSLCGQGYPSPALALACGADKGTAPCRWQQIVEQCPRSAPASADDGWGAPHQLARFESADAANEQAGAKMALVWPTKGSALFRQQARTAGVDDRAFDLACEPAMTADQYILNLPQALLPDPKQSMLPLRMATWLERRSRPLCPYVDTVPMRTVLLRYGQPEVVELAQKVIAGSILMIGANFVGQSDRHSAPLREEVAGVHVHAMALDNLLTYGDQWRRVGDFDLSDWRAAGTRYPLAAVTLIVLGWEVQYLIGAVMRRRQSRGDPPLTDKLFDAWPRAWRWATAVKNVLLMSITFGRLPSPRRGKVTPRTMVIGYAATVLWWLFLIGFLFHLANDLFHVGPLSQVEYVIAPLALGFVDHAHHLTRRAVLLWASAAPPASLSPAQFVRDLRDISTDEAWERKLSDSKFDSQLTQPQADAAEGQPDPAPAAPRTPP